MKSHIIITLLTVASLAVAQGPHSPQGQPQQPNQPGHGPGAGQAVGMPTGTGIGLDMAKVQTIEGAVTAISIAYGAQYPSIQIGQTTIKVAPVWFLLERDFEIKVGDKLKVTAAPSLQTRDPYLSAVTLTNTATGVTITLRDGNGIPVWVQQAGQPNGQPGTGAGTGACGACASCGGPVSVATVSGAVEQVTAGVGMQMPTLVLKTTEGKVLTIKIGPERILETADFEIRAGDTLTVRYAVTCTEETVALDLTNAAGVKLVLRDDTGAPCWR